MPPAEGYRRQTTPRAGAPLPQQSAASFGAGVGQELERLGQTAHRANVQEYQVERRLNQNRQWSEFQVEFAAAREAQAAEAREGRKSDDPGHAERMAKTWQQREEALLSRFEGEEGLRDRARGTLATWGGAFREGEASWETVRAGEVTTENYRQGLSASANRVRRLENPEDYVLEMKVELDMIDGLDVPDEVKEKLETEARQTMAVSFLQGRIDDDPALAKAMLDSGAFDTILEPQQVDALLNGSAVEIRRAEAAAERMRNQAEAMLRDELGLFSEKEGNGTADYSELPAMRQRAAELGLEKEVEQIDNYIAGEAFAREYEGAPPVQLERDLAAINAKGDKASDEEKRKRNWIEGHLPGIEGRYKSDPVGFYAREGGDQAPPALDFADPGSIRARERWAKSLGVDQPFSSVELVELRRIYDGGRQGEENAMTLLGQMSPPMAMRAARQLDPEDKSLPVLVTLDGNHRALARRGKAKLAEQGDFLSRHTKEDVDLEEAIDGLDARLEQALRSVAPEQRAEIRAAAREITAGAMDKNGAALTEGTYWNAIQTSLGARRNPEGQLVGGIGLWNDNYFLVPSGLTAREFSGQVARAARTAETKPVNPDGSPASLSRGVFPVAVEAGWYEFRTPGGRVVKGSNGKPWRVRPRSGS